MAPEPSAAPTGLRVAFAGTPEFARTALQHLLEAGYRPPLVLTQPDRPAGRGLKLQASAVKQLALAHGLPVAQPRSLRLDGKYPQDAAAAELALRDARPDVLVVAAYGLILPQWVLSLPRLGCINIHGSLLPRWRGAAPVQRAIEAGDAQHRHLHHADGCRAGHRRHPAPRIAGHRAGRHQRQPVAAPGRTGRAAAAAHAARSGRRPGRAPGRSRPTA